MNKTIFLDIDGCILQYVDDYMNVCKGEPVPETPGAAEKMYEWHSKGYYIVLTTGRTEALRDITVESLRKAGMIYDQLVMGVGPWQRVLINDLEPDNPERPKAVAINVKRNEGIKHLDI